LASTLQRALQAFAKPWYRLRALSIFRDDASLSANPGLWSSIEAALDSSRFLVLLASENAARSPWVEQEVRHWCDTKDPRYLLIAVTDDEAAAGASPSIVWDVSTNDFDWNQTSVLPPSLRAVFKEEPRFVQLGWARGQQRLSLRDPLFRAAIADLAAPLRGRPKDELIGEDIRLHRRAIRLARGAVVVLVILLLLASSSALIAVRQRDTAVAQRDIANSRLLLADASALGNSRPNIALLLRLAAWRATGIPEARSALLRSLSQSAYTGGTRGPPVNGLALSPNGHLVATANGVGGATPSPDDAAILWDVSHPMQPVRLATLTGHTGGVNAVAFSPNGHVLATGSRDTTAILWDVTDPRHPARLGTLRGHVNSVDGIAFSADGSVLATASGDGSVILWDVREPARRIPVSTLLGAAAASGDVVGTGPGVTGVAFSRDTHLLADVRSDGTAILWDVADAAHPVHVATIVGTAAILKAVAFSPDGHLLVTASSDKTAMVWDVSKPAQPLPRTSLTGTDGPVRSLAFSPDGQTVALSSEDGHANVWNVENPNAPVQVASLAGDTSGVLGVVFDHSNSVLVTGSSSGAVTTWNLDGAASPNSVAALRGQNTLGIGVLGGVRTILANADPQRGATLWDATNFGQPAPLGLLVGTNLRTVAFSGDGRTVVSVESTNNTTLWDITDPKAPISRSTLSGIGHDDDIVTAAFSPNGHILVTAGSAALRGDGSHPGLTILWDVTHADHPIRLATLADHTDLVVAVAFSPDGHTLATGGFDKTARLWDISRPGQPIVLTELTDHSGSVLGVAFSPDGQTLATGSQDKTTLLWNVSRPRRPVRVATLTGATSSVGAVVFSAQHGLLATAGYDDRVLLWDVKDPRYPTQLAVLTGQTKIVGDVAFTANGQRLVTAAGDGSDVAWDLRPTVDVVLRLADVACAMAGSGLTREDWNRYANNVPFRPTCSTDGIGSAR
jgi:WD40 repeat protein